MFWRKPRTGPAPEAERRADPLRVVLACHEATKHDFHRFAAGPPELDWDTQPDPFRTFEGAPRVRLARAEPAEGERPFYEESFCAGAVEARELDVRSLAQLLFDSLALSGSKKYGEARWTLRVNPSSGNLHPTEAYVIAGPLVGASESAFVAHYEPREHALELRAQLSAEIWREFETSLGAGTFFVALTSIHWREAWKYGERAFRYSQLDCGHAIAALAVAAAALGWSAHVLDEASHAELARLCGTDRQSGPEAEVPETLVAIRTRAHATRPAVPGASVFERLRQLEHVGRPNDLSTGHVDWSAIEVVEEATRAARTEPAAESATFQRAWKAGEEPISLRKIVRQRRSAVAFDARSAIARDAFEQLLRRLLPRERDVVLAGWPWAPRVDVLAFVHRVEGLEPGLYLLLRDAAREARWRERSPVVASAERVVVEGVGAEELTLLRLERGDARSLARSVSCQQDIAADGCAALAFLAAFDASLATWGPRAYRRLHWECGFLGQLVYLEAEALGLRGTGIGCFFDDAVHRRLGLVERSFQSLYHFTFGGPVEDARIESGPAYGDESA